MVAGCRALTLVFGKGGWCCRFSRSLSLSPQALEAQAFFSIGPRCSVIFPDFSVFVNRVAAEPAFNVSEGALRVQELPDDEGVLCECCLWTGNRCSQSTVFRRLTKNNAFVGRGDCATFPPEVQEAILSRRVDFSPDDVAAAAACAAFIGEPSFASVSSRPKSPVFLDIRSGTRALGRVQTQMQTHARNHVLYDPSLCSNCVPAANNTGRNKRGRLQSTRPPSKIASSRDPVGAPESAPSKIARSRDPVSRQESDCQRLRRAPNTMTALPIGSGLPEAGARGPHTEGENIQCCRRTLTEENGKQTMTCARASGSHPVTANVACDARDDVEHNVHVESKRKFGSTVISGSGKRLTAGGVLHVGGARLRAPPRMDEDDSDGARINELATQYGQFMREYKAVHQPRISSAQHASKIGSANMGARQATKGVDKLICRMSSPCFDRCMQRAAGMKYHKLGSGRLTGASIASDQLFCGPPGRKPAAYASPVVGSSGISRNSDDQLRNNIGSFLEKDEPSESSPCALGGVRYPALVRKESDGFSEVYAHDGAVTCLLPSPDGSFLISSGGDGRIRLWNAATGSHCFVHMSLNVPRHNSHAAGFSEGHRRHAPQPPARLGSLPEAAGTKTKTSQWGRQAAMLCSGEYIIHGRGSFLCTYDVFTGAEQHIITAGHTRDIVCVAWNNQNGEAYSGASDGTILIFDSIRGSFVSMGL